MEAGNARTALVNIAETGDQLKTVGGRISDIGSSLTTKVTAPIVAVAGVAASKFAEVDKTMILANKTMGNSTDEANILNDAMSDATTATIPAGPDVHRYRSSSSAACEALLHVVLHSAPGTP